MQWWTSRWWWCTHSFQGHPSRKGPPPLTLATTCDHCGSDIREGATGLLAHLRTPWLPMRSQEGLRSGHWLQLGALFLLSSVASSSGGRLGMGQFYKKGSRSVWVTQEAGWGSVCVTPTRQFLLTESPRVGPEPLANSLPEMHMRPLPSRTRGFSPLHLRSPQSLRTPLPWVVWFGHDQTSVWRTAGTWARLWTWVWNWN